jgi:hypothetical protein
MICKSCKTQVGRVVGTIYEGRYVEYCPSCAGISEIGIATDYASPRAKQRREWDRSRHAKDIMQPWEMKRGEVKKGWQPNKNYIKAYGSDPDKLSIYTQEELKSTGMVSEKTAKKAKEGKYKDAKRLASDFG